jgi:hypothetical protein
MSQSLRRVSRAVAVVRLGAMALVALVAITCTRDQPTAPIGQILPTHGPLRGSIPNDSGLRALESPAVGTGHINVLADGNYELVPHYVGTYPTPTIVTAHVSGTATGSPWKQPWYFTEKGYLGNCGGYMPLLAGWNECLSSRYIRVSGSVQMAGNWLPTPANCGQWDTDPCPTFSGGYDGVLDRLDATIEVAPTDTAIHPGGTATIQWHAVPDSLGGFATPTTFERGYFDPDSSGGYPADTTRACTVIGNSCRIAPRGSGTLHLWVMANGQLVHKTAHITLPTLVLAASPTAGHPGVRVTFTPSWSDGTALAGGVNWQWTPDTSPAKTSACGYSGWNFVCITQVYESGEMTVILNFNGSDFRATAPHVVVYSTFTLSADKSIVAPGDDVTFTPKLDGQPTAAARWKWKPSAGGGVDNAPCPAGASACTKKVMASGTMWAYLQSTPGTGDSASASVTVDTTLGTGGGGNESGGDVCPPGALCSSAKLTIIRSDGVAGDQVPPDVSTYPIGTKVAYSFAPAPGYREIALVVDDTGRAATDSLTMDHDHVIEIGADSNYLANPEIKAVADSLWNMVHSSDAPEHYASILRWYREQATLRGDEVMAHLVGVAEYARFDLGRDSASLRAFDDALGGVVFHLLRQGAETNFDYTRPGDYSPVTTTSVRRHGDISTQAATNAFPTNTPAIVYVNGILTDSAKFSLSTTKLKRLVLSTPLAAQVFVDHFYNPTFAVEEKTWQDPETGLANFCADKGRRDLQYTDALVMASRYASCMGVKFGKWLYIGDFPQSLWQMLQQKYKLRLTVEQTALDLGYFTAALHRAGDETIFVTHSQGNLMFAQMIQNLDAFESPQTKCIAELSLASPIGQSHFSPLPPRYLAGMTIKWDILWQLRPYTDNDFTLQLTARSDSADAQIPTLTGTALIKAYADWGLKIHEPNDNYLVGGVSGYVAQSLVDLHERCATWPQ